MYILYIYIICIYPCIITMTQYYSYSIRIITHLVLVHDMNNTVFRIIHIMYELMFGCTLGNIHVEYEYPTIFMDSRIIHAEHE